MDPSGLTAAPPTSAAGHGLAFVDTLVGSHPRLFAAGLAVLVLLVIVLLFEVNKYKSKCPAGKSSFYGGHHAYLGGESAAGTGTLTNTRGDLAHQAIIGHRQRGGGHGAAGHLNLHLTGQGSVYPSGPGATLPLAGGAHEGFSFGHLERRMKHLGHHGWKDMKHLARREGLAPGAPAGPCGAGQTAVSYQDEGGATLVRCVDPPMAFGSCGAAWGADATAEAQALASVGGLEHDTYGEDALQMAIGD